MLKKELEHRLKVIESNLELYKKAEKEDSLRIKELESQVKQLLDSEVKAEIYKGAMIRIFNDALNTVNMGDYTPKGLMRLIVTEFSNCDEGLTTNELLKMFD